MESETWKQDEKKSDDVDVPCLGKRDVRQLDEVVSNTAKTSEDLGERSHNQLLGMAVLQAMLLFQCSKDRQNVVTRHGIQNISPQSLQQQEQQR